MKSLKHLWINRPGTDWVLALLLAGAAQLAATETGAGLFLELTNEGRTGMFQVLAATSGALLGFFITTVTILLVFLDAPGRRMHATLGEGRHRDIARVFFSAIRAAFFSLVVFLAGALFLVDRTGPGWGTVPLVDPALFATSALLLLRSGRVIWVSHGLIDIRRQDAKEEGSS